MVLERAELLRLHPAQAEVLEDRLLGLHVHAPAAVGRLRHPRLAAVERRDDRLDPVGRERHRASPRISAARRHSSSVGTSAMRQ